MDSFPGVHLDLEPEETPPSSQLEQRYKAKLAKQMTTRVNTLHKKIFQGIASTNGSQRRGNMKMP